MLRSAVSRALLGAMLPAGAALLAVSAGAQTSFSAHTVNTSSDLVSVIGHGDFNGDGREDLIASDMLNGTAQNGLLYLSNGDGTYDAPIRLPQPVSAGKFSIGDFNGDGKLDFVAQGASGTQMNVYLGNGDGTFQAARTTSDGTTDILTWLVAADMNHDNKTDIVEAMTTQGGPDILQVWISNGDGTFKAGQRITSGVITTSFGMVTGDFDGDGKADVAIVRSFQGPTQIQVWYGDGAGNLGTPYQVTDPDGYEDLYGADGVVDINSDGKSDLVTSRFQYGTSGTSADVPQIELIEGNANRTLTFVNVPTTNCPYNVTAADYNGDGYNDLAFAEEPCPGANSVATGPFTYVVRPGSSSGSFGAEQTIYNTAYDSSDLQTVKASQGSKPDLVLTQHTTSNYNAGPTSVELLSNTSSGSFPGCNTANLAEGITVCQPSGSSASSPVQFSIAAAGPTPMRTAAVWVDGSKVNEQLRHAFSHYSFLDQSLTLANGTHTITVFGTGWDDTIEKKSFSLTVGSGSGGPCAAPSSPGVNVCSPANGSTVGSPTQFSAAANVPGTLARMEIWMDGYKQYTETTSSQLSASLNLAAGYHRFDIYAVNTAGAKYATTVYATVTSGGGSCPADPGYDVHICTPVSGSTVSSPVQVSATAHITGTLARMEVWVDGVKKYSETSSLTLNTSIPVPSGKNHRFDVYAVNTAGQKWESSVFATVP